MEAHAGTRVAVRALMRTYILHGLLLSVGLVGCASPIRQWRCLHSNSERCRWLHADEESIRTRVEDAEPTKAGAEPDMDGADHGDVDAPPQSAPTSTAASGGSGSAALDAPEPAEDASNASGPSDE